MKYDTTKCILIITDTGMQYEEENIYCIKSIRKSDKSYLIRFGTADQIQSILNTYNDLKEKRFTL